MSAASPRSVVLPLAVGLFAAGVLAVLAVFGSYAAGLEDLPLWLNLATLLAPAGLVVGVVGAVLRTRRG
ncbi:MULTISPECIES: hypothetical protein [unclassified Saccharopolyspora]|uniref:hypothetical protein n=1 Tax=unclassified Saccharopolyspora TaxID=2646250 RepID=UPI001CD57DC0|nr:MULTISPECIES: hypothetical protein [unclassified Saccharopolyspora]MCA1186447.1 hypothetical protein [Saccharopolyspora sp. 6T]MCA1193562.1 hypothetical protein [Saccharopolyspora sp. 6V]MCA1227550.1 hypothetical protein [Saccharopolyspora sp. 6M]MCA1280073.1 hypothetical protein [Saccharopolyspora sp. 7B]